MYKINKYTSGSLLLLLYICIVCIDRRSTTREDFKGVLLQ